MEVAPTILLGPYAIRVRRIAAVREGGLPRWCGDLLPLLMTDQDQVGPPRAAGRDILPQAALLMLITQP